ncbi:hypothetical protein KBD11_00940 [Candidatus Saccharibacteria bacterium]|nr:hypothetical protein [Candidatus Saccharibacteria bacterium]
MMLVAVLLAFYFVFSSYHHSAGATQQTAVGLRFYQAFCWVASLFYDGLHFIKKFLGNNWRMFTLVNLAAIHEMTVIKGVFQDIFYFVFAVRLTASSFYTTLI